MAQTIVQMVAMVMKSLVGKIKSRVPRFHRRVLFSNTSQKRKRRPQEIQQSHRVSQLNHTDSHAKIQSNKVLELAQHNTRMGEVYQEVSNFSKTKEVQAMLLAEQFINADLDALKSYERKEGAYNEKREAAKEMLSDGVSVNKIHKYLKLPIETITELQKEFNKENSDKDDDFKEEDDITDEHPLLDSFGDMDELKRIQEEREQEKQQQKENAASTTNSGKVDKGTKLPKMNIKSNHKF